MIVRSHECVRKGYDEPFAAPNNKLLCTLFSASNYSGGDNDGAYMVFTAHMMQGAEQVMNSNLSYTVRHFKTSDAQASLLSTNMTSLQALILKKKNALLQAFKVADVDNKGVLSKMVWANIMHELTQIGIMWQAMLPKIAPPECIQNNHVNYTLFLHSFSTNVGDSESTDGSIMDCMYAQRSKMEAIFYFFDKDGSGTISRAEFSQGCDILNRTLPSDQNLTDYDHILDMMDFDRNDSIDINEFFEVNIQISSFFYSLFIVIIVIYVGISYIRCERWEIRWSDINSETSLNNITKILSFMILI
jgi:Ca2+-binding EF-hand superfamily protein